MFYVFKKNNILISGMFFSTPSILRNNRLRRDTRALEEEEEMWFDNDDDFEDTDNIMPMADMLKTRVESAEFDQFDRINKYLERNRFLGKCDFYFLSYRVCSHNAIFFLAKENDMKVTSPRLLPPMGSHSININISRTSPPGSPDPTPASSPANSPVTSPKLSTGSPLGDRSNSPTAAITAKKVRH